MRGGRGDMRLYYNKMGLNLTCQHYELSLTVVSRGWEFKEREENAEGSKNSKHGGSSRK